MQQIERDWFARCEVVPSAEAIMAKIKECRRGLATKEYLKRCEGFTCYSLSFHTVRNALGMAINVF